MPENSYAIYQLNQGIENRNRAFMPLKYLREKCIPVQRKRYVLVYQGALAEGDTLDDLYLRFNLYQPADFTGHSLSVSDVVVLRKYGIETAFYVDDMGFSEVPEFLQGNNEGQLK